MANKTFIPALEFPGKDSITDPVDQIEYTMAFILSNPDGTSELNQRHMTTISEELKKYATKPYEFAKAVERKLASVVNNELGLSHTVSVRAEEIENGRFNIQLTISDDEGNVLRQKGYLEQTINRRS